MFLNVLTKKSYTHSTMTELRFPLHHLSHTCIPSKITYDLLGLGESALVDHSNLVLVGLFRTGSDGTARFSSNVSRDLVGVVFGLLESSDQSWLNVSPCTIVQWLFLRPDNVGVRVLVEMRSKEIVWQRAELFDSGDGNVVVALLFSLF